MNTTSCFFTLLLCSLWQPMISKAGPCVSQQTITPPPKNGPERSSFTAYTGKRVRGNTMSPSPPASRSEESRSSKAANHVQK